MPACFRRAAARTALSVLFMVYLGACTATERVELSTKPKLDDVAGITSRSGKDTPFERKGVVIENNMLYGSGPKGQIIVPTDSIQTVWVKTVSTGKTLGLVAALALVLTVFIKAANRSASTTMSSP